jgi:hypothetical protein
MRPPLIAIVLLGLLGAPHSLALDDPQQLIRALYRLPSIPTKSKDIDRFFARDLAAAIKKDIAPTGEIGATNDGDYRYDAQDARISGLSFADSGAEQVTVRFKNFGKPQIVIYSMCLAKTGWRIANVRLADWDMRKALKLPAAPVRC